MYFESSLHTLKKSREDIFLSPLFLVPLTLRKPIWLQFLNVISAEFLFCAVDPYTERVRFEILYNYPPGGEGGVNNEARRRGVCISSTVHQPWGLSIYQISWIKMKKVTFCKLKPSLSRSFTYNFIQTFRGLCQVHFTILLQILHENNLVQYLTWTSNFSGRLKQYCLLFSGIGALLALLCHRFYCFHSQLCEPFSEVLLDWIIFYLPGNTYKPKIVAFLVFVCKPASSIVFRKCLEARRHLGSGRKTVNNQGYSELREPIKTREKCCSLIW